MNQAMRIKQLELTVAKSGVIIFGSKKIVQNLKKEIETKQCLTIDGLRVKVKSQEKYLGDYLHECGLAQSVQATVSKRYGICLQEILEL